jgi:ferredoxin
MKVSIDRDQCISCGVCWSQCPEVFEEDSGDGKSSVVAALRAGGDPARGEAPESLRASAEDAAAACPVSVIKVE